MTREQVEEMLTILSREFRIRKPKLEWSRRNNSGYAVPRKNTIRMGYRYPPNSLQQEDVAIHEFAHILEHHLYPPKTINGVRPFARGFRRRGHHREEFCYCLWKVVTAWYGDGNQSKYNWRREYKRVAAFGLRRLEAGY